MKDRIFKREFDKIIKRTMNITAKERAFLDETFGSNLVSGLTVPGLRIKIDELLYSKKNIISHHKLESIKGNIISELAKANQEQPKEKPKSKPVSPR